MQIPRSKFRMFLAPIMVVLCISSTSLYLTSFLAGCAMDAAQREELIAESNRVQQQANTERERQIAEAARQQALLEEAMRAGDEQAARRAEEARDKANRAVALLDKVIAMVQQGHTVFEASVDPSGAINVQPAAVAIGTAVGGPVGSAIAVGIPLLTSLVASLGWFRKTKEAQENLKAAESIVTNLDRGFMLNETFDSLGTQLWPKIEMGMTEKAKQIVNTVSVT